LIVDSFGRRDYDLTFGKNSWKNFAKKEKKAHHLNYSMAKLK